MLFRSSVFEKTFKDKAEKKFESLKKDVNELEKKASAKVESLKQFEFESDKAKHVATTEANAAMKNADANTKNAATNEKMYENDKVRTAAMKLAAEWHTGEFTNWKTWVDTSCQGINTVGNAIENISDLIPEKKVLGGAVKSAQGVRGFRKY